MFGKLKDRISSAFGSLKAGFSLNQQDSYTGPTGELLIKMVDGETGEVLEDRTEKNVITQDFSILLARLCRDSQDPNHGIYALAVGTGDSGWDLQSPPSPTDTQRSLYNEIDRKDFVTVDFKDSGGSTTAVPTNVVDFTCTFNESEAVGALVEMGLLGGDINDDLNVTNPVTPANGPYDDTVDVTGKDLLCNYFTFPVINKPSTAKLTITWRITF